MDWKKVLSDKTTYPDNLELTLNGEQVTVGSLREHNIATQGETATALQQREAVLTTRERTQEEATTRLANIVERISQSTGLSFNELIAGDSAAAVAAAARIKAEADRAGITATGDGKIDWKTDPIYSPVDARLSPIEAGIQSLTAAVKASLQVYGNDRPRIAYNQIRLDNPDATKGIKFDDAVKHAVEKGYKDEVGFTDVVRAMQDLMQPGLTKNREEELVKTAEEKGYAKARAEMLGGAGQPAGGGAAGLEFVAAPDKPSGRPASIADQLSKALSDPDILRMTGTVN